MTIPNIGSLDPGTYCVDLARVDELSRTITTVLHAEGPGPKPQHVHAMSMLKIQYSFYYDIRYIAYLCLICVRYVYVLLSS